MKSSLNLMSEHSRRRVQLRRSWRIWSRVLVGAVLLIAVRGVWQWRSYSEYGQRQAAAELDYEPLQKLKRDSQRLRLQIKKFQETEQVALALTKEEPMLGLVGLVSQAVVEAKNKVYLQRIDIHRDPLALIATQSPGLTFSLTGSTIDSSAVGTLEDRLRKSGPFDAVQLKKSQATRLGKITQQSFTLKCTN